MIANTIKTLSCANDVKNYAAGAHSPRPTTMKNTIGLNNGRPEASHESGAFWSPSCDLSLEKSKRISVRRQISGSGGGSVVAGKAQDTTIKNDGNWRPIN